MNSVIINGVTYPILKLLGKGKGGFSYLGEFLGKLVVYKMIHHEPCNYYTFGNKIESEKNDYNRLVKAGIRVPKLIYVDDKQEIIIKEYIGGPTIEELLIQKKDVNDYIQQVIEMAKQARTAGLNIDYFPTNFVVKNELLYYIDYECNDYMDEWSFDNWGKKYWSYTEEFKEYLKSKER